MADKAQKAKIHIAKKELNLTDVEYEGLLAGFGVSSSRDLSYGQAEKLLDSLKERGWKPKVKRQKANGKGGGSSRHGWGKNKYEYLRPRPANMADPKQLRKIEAMWREIARNPGDDSLEQFVERQTGIKKLLWLEKNHVRSVLTALKAMKTGNSTEYYD